MREFRRVRVAPAHPCAGTLSIIYCASPAACSALRASLRPSSIRCLAVSVEASPPLPAVERTADVLGGDDLDEPDAGGGRRRAILFHARHGKVLFISAAAAE